MNGKLQWRGPPAIGIRSLVKLGEDSPLGRRSKAFRKHRRPTKAGGGAFFDSPFSICGQHDFGPNAATRFWVALFHGGAKGLDLNSLVISVEKLLERWCNSVEAALWRNGSQWATWGAQL